ncbi:MAG TPA: ABC transporter permease [Candidatus Limnocylindrales bacterium]|nr:ABC transporter permease [Candidatus Limnocylindrales bacterium]
MPRAHILRGCFARADPAAWIGREIRHEIVCRALAPVILLRMILRRLGALVPTLFGVATLVFLLLHVVPGDPVDVMIGESAAPAARAELRTRLGLDEPLGVQYARWLGAIAHGDLGSSIRSGKPVASLVAARIPATALLAVAALIVAVTIGIPLGTAAAATRGSAIDRFALAASLAAVATPTFWTGPMLVLLLSVALGWLPVAGSGTPAHLVLPAITLGAGMSGILIRMTRASLLETLSDDYVRTARAKGASPMRVLFVHALPNALTPVLSVLGLQLGAVLAGAVVTETIFAWPGLGRLVVESIQARDYPVVQGAVLVVATTTVLANLAAEIAQALVDPRIGDAGDAR